jgi:pyruvate/2-oxoacid:ferredoxin oxidoreductase beta subunit/Pyruvate/2-oxoacid:ferredoxin oxidoreductase gamma subunit
MLVDKNSPYCPGCGHQSITVGLAKALESLNYDPLDVIIVSDIGCCGLIDPMLACHTIHGLHGRACALASGISIAIENPKKKVIAIQGDGGATIGIAHLLEAARRNFNLTLIVNNNQIYGMTGGQFSGLSNETFQSDRGIIDTARPFDIVEIAHKAGANYSARIIAKGDTADKLKTAISSKGFSLIEILEVCPSYGVQKYSDIEHLGYLEKSFVNAFNPFTLHETLQKPLVKKDHAPIPSGFKDNLVSGIKIILAGSAGEGIQSAAELFAKAAMYSGLHVTKKGDYPITVGTGFSVSELIFSPDEIYHTGINEPDVLLVISQNGFDYVKNRIGDKTSVIIDNAIHYDQMNVSFTYDFKAIFGKKNATICSIGLWLLMNEPFPFAAFEKAVKESKHGEKLSPVIEKIKTVFDEIKLDA